MTTAAIDIDTLNNLFDNQKKLDDIFNSMFDNDDTLIGGSVSHKAQTVELDAQVYSEITLNFDNNLYEPQKRNIVYLIFPVVLEIAALYYGIAYFI